MLEEEIPYAQVDIARYDRGWFSSDVVLDFSLSDEYAKNPNADISLTDEMSALSSKLFSMQLKVRHGPVILSWPWLFGLGTIESTVVPAQGYLADFMKAANLEYLLRIKAKTNLSGVWEYILAMPEFGLGQEGGGIEFGGMQGSGEIDIANNMGDGKIEFPGLTVTSATGIGMTLDNMQISSDMYMPQDPVWLGSAGFTVEKIVFLQAGDLVFTLDDVLFNTLTELLDDEEHISVAIDYELGAMTGLEGYDLSDIKLGFLFDSIPYDLVVAYQEIGHRGAEGTSTDMSELSAMLYDYIAVSPSVQIDPVTLKLNGDTANLNLRFDFDADALPEYASFDVANVFMWTGLVSGTGQFDIVKPFALILGRAFVERQLADGLSPGSAISPEQMQAVDAQASAMLTSLVEQGLLIENETNYTADIKYESGILFANDKPVPLDL